MLLHFELVLLHFDEKNMSKPTKYAENIIEMSKYAAKLEKNDNNFWVPEDMETQAGWISRHL